MGSGGEECNLSFVAETVCCQGEQELPLLLMLFGISIFMMTQLLFSINPSCDDCNYACMTLHHI